MEPLVRASLATRAFFRRGHGLAARVRSASYVVWGGVRDATGPLADRGRVGVGAAARCPRAAEAPRDGRRTRRSSTSRSARCSAVGARGRARPVRRRPRAGAFAPRSTSSSRSSRRSRAPRAGLVVVAWIARRSKPALRWAALARGRRRSASRPTRASSAPSRCSTSASCAPRSRGSAPRRAPASRRSSCASRRTREATGCSARAKRADRDEVRSDRLARASVEEIHQSVHYALDLLRRSLDLHTAVLLWLNDAGTHLRISELSTASDDIHDAPFAAGDGVLGAVLAQRTRVSLHGLKPSVQGPLLRGAVPGARARGASRCSTARRSAASSRSTALENTRVHAARGGDRGAGRALLPARHPERARLPAARAREGRAGQALSRGAGARRRRSARRTSSTPASRRRARSRASTSPR